MDYCIENYLVDRKFVDAVRSVVDFMDSQKIHHGDKFKFKKRDADHNHDVYYELREWLFYKTDPEHPECANGFRKSDFIDRLEHMFNCIISGNIKKSILKFYDETMTNYCDQLKLLQFKQKNRIKTTKMTRKNKNALSAKPFVIQNDDDERKVYLPDRTVKTPKNPVTKQKQHICSCVHVCDQFLTYPVIEYGIRYIPTGKVCKYRFGQTCFGNLLLADGKYLKEIEVPHILKNNIIRPDHKQY